MIIGILFIVFIILLVIFMVRRMNPIYDSVDDEVVTTTTTTTTTDAPDYVVVGTLRRQAEGKQFFVIDPVDSEKIWVNSGDDMFQDADGKIWKVV